MEHEPFVMNMETNCTGNFFFLCVCVCVLQDVSLCETSFLDGHMKATDFKEEEGLTSWHWQGIFLSTSHDCWLGTSYGFLFILNWGLLPLGAGQEDHEADHLPVSQDLE